MTEQEPCIRLVRGKGEKFFLRMYYTNYVVRRLLFFKQLPQVGLFLLNPK